MKADISYLARWRHALLLTCALATASCAKIEATASGTGETHFLSTCDSECPGDLECLCGVCTRPCDANDACNTLGGTCQSACSGAGMVCDRACSSDDACADLGGEFQCEDDRCRMMVAVPDAGRVDDPLVCAPGCEPALAYPMDEDRACVLKMNADDTDAAQAVACLCDVGTDLLHELSCRRRLSDGSLWALYLNGELQEAAAWSACNREQDVAALTSCEYVDCDRPPRSTCSFDSHCTSGGCYGLETDERGCRRRACASDVECESDERCTAIECASDTRCAESASGMCQCGGLDNCAFEDLCSPIAIAGPRGEWIRLQLLQTGDACTDESCQDVRTFMPNGAFSRSSPAGDTSGTLMDFDLGDLRRDVDGAQLRLALRDGIPCDEPATDVAVRVILELSTETLERDVTGCVGGPTDNVFQILFMDAQRYTE